MSKITAFTAKISPIVEKTEIQKAKACFENEKIKEKETEILTV